MDSLAVSSVSSLSEAQQSAIKRGGYSTVAELLLAPQGEVARRCRIATNDAERILDVVCESLSRRPRSLETVIHEGEERFSTGDAMLDDALGGGIRAGMLWEVVGESAAGKTQLALQLSLMVQLPPNSGGASGSACYITTSANLPTNRLAEIMECHPALSPSLCGLSDIHTIKTPEIPILLYILDTTLPGLIEQIRAQSDRKPVKLVVIDTLTELFHSHSKVSADTLRERSKNLAEISTLLHQLANKYRIAVLVLNEVMDVVCKGYAPDTVPSKDILYREQARWFNRADSIAGEDRKEASLGLVWANQINARIMLSRTERTRFLEVEQRKPKRRRLDPTRTQHCSETQPTRIRRLSIIFSSVGPPASLDYIVSEGGIFVLPDTTEPNPTPPSSSTPLQPPSSSPSHEIDGISPLDVGIIADEVENDHDEIAEEDARLASVEDGPQREGEGNESGSEWDAYWQEAESDADLYRNVHID